MSDIDPRENVADPRFEAMRQQNEGFVKYQLDNRDEMEELKADLLGMEWDEEQNKYVPSDSKEALMNSKGANAVITFLKEKSSKNVSLSKHDIDDIRKRCQVFLIDLSFLLSRKKRNPTSPLARLKTWRLSW